MKRQLAAALALLVLAGGRVVPALAQDGAAGRRVVAQARIAGTVADRDGAGLPGVELILADPAGTPLVAAHSDDSGHFAFAGAVDSIAVIRLRRLGYEPKTVTLRATRSSGFAAVYIVLEPMAARLDAVMTEADSATLEDPRIIAFTERSQTNAFGHYIGPTKIKQMRLVYASDALRGVPGVNVRPSRRIGNEVRIRGCSPLVWVDGVREPYAELDDVARGNDIAAIEVYNSFSGIPARYFDRSATCGTILVWLRVR